MNFNTILIVKFIFSIFHKISKFNINIHMNATSKEFNREQDEKVEKEINLGKM